MVNCVDWDQRPHSGCTVWSVLSFSILRVNTALFFIPPDFNSAVTHDSIALDLKRVQLNQVKP